MSFLLGIEITENTDLIKFILSKIQEIGLGLTSDRVTRGILLEEYAPEII